MSSQPTTPKQSPRIRSRTTTPRIASPRPQPGQIYSPSTNLDIHQRYDATLLASPISSETGQSFVKKPFKQTLSASSSRRNLDEELELGQVPTLSRSPSAHQPQSSPFHDSNSWRRSREFVDGKPPQSAITLNNGLNLPYLPSAMSPSESQNGLFDPSDPYGSPQKRRDLLEALGYDVHHLPSDSARIPDTPTADDHNLEKEMDDNSSSSSTWKPPRPSLRLLFSLCTARDFFLHMVPCIIFSLGAGAIPPIMTTLIGDVFGAFSTFPPNVISATPEQRSTLTRDVGKSCLTLFGIGVAGWAANTLMLIYWSRLGEVIANRLRAEVYRSVMGRGMEWFDLGMGFKSDTLGTSDTKEDGEEAGVGAGGLMAKFTRESDDVRIACGQSMGEMVQHLTTFLSCTILALVKSYSLTLVTLSAIPLAILVQIVTQTIANPLFAAERRALEDSSTAIERTTNAVSTVKAFNAQNIEKERFAKGVSRARRTYIAQTITWSINNGVTDLLLQIMFVASFWYGTKLVRSGKESPATIMTVFWACLLGSSSLQAGVPHLVSISQGKASMASLINMIKAPSPAKKLLATVRRTLETIDEDDYSPSPFSPLNVYPNTPGTTDSKTSALQTKKIVPDKAQGEFVLRNVSFAYPSRPETLALHDVSIFLPAGETTFIVGGSGSGKTTIAQLILRLYEPDIGDIQLDDNNLKDLDYVFTREHVSAVQQGCIMFDMSVHDNVSMGLAGMPGRKPEDATRAEVVQACQMAMLDEFITSLPEGYETKLGTKGASLSGGQRQRLAIARARLRDPTILVLDEATSALDMASRLAVFEAIKAWRKNRTTIVITHDLSQILPTDFVYLMKDGRLVEQGYRADLMVTENSEFGKLATLQAEEPILERDRDPWEEADQEVEMILENIDQEDSWRKTMRRSTMNIGPAHPSRGYLDYLSFIDDQEKPIGPASSYGSASGSRVSALATLEERRTSDINRPQDPPRLPFLTERRYSTIGRQLSIRFERQSVTHNRRISRNGLPRHSMFIVTTNADGEMVDSKAKDTIDPDEAFVATIDNAPKLYRVIMDYFPGMPKKWLLVVGSICSVAHVVMTPLWSKYIAGLMAEVSYGGADTSGITKTSVIVIGITIANAVSLTGMSFFMETMGAHWMSGLRTLGYAKVLSQPQSWFDKRSNSPSRLVQVLIKDVDDMKEILSTIIGRSITAGVMVVVGLAWAMAIGWKLTLVGLAVAPIFALMVVVSSRVNTGLEATNKEAREQVSRTLYESVANVRSIRAMALDDTFLTKFQAELNLAQRTGFRAAIGRGGGTGITAGVPYFVQALMLYVSAIYMIKGYYNFATIMQVYTMVLFSVTFASQFLDFVPSIAKSRMAAASFSRLRNMEVESDESKGDLRFPITGNIAFSHVAFNYPTRPDAPVLQDVTFEVRTGECICIVGPSGSGKSTISALLQRLYEPLRGQIQLDGYSLDQTDVKWLREHIAVVSQQPNMFDASVSENIAYGSMHVPIEEIHRAAKAANVHDFVMSLPQGYDTNLGENASLISGGQAQRLQIARALVRQSSILILDECTSALDPENQRMVLDTIMRVKEDKTTIFITHKADVMKRCDRVLCLEDGRIAESGSYAQLMARRGVFASLMRAAEFE
ncbi:hypothetical protein QFC22_002674 [Naganishia vaughanmartiniae]|uniref:Uncharacterized protein n=1 Tax=Naganishia vaughanmartiniae TaxID=1424756 RepID=A0ACC2X9P7_9TREE|nr:hypothetical protein QFC22_002674 [Naganishia vaughanmartiniae]